MRNKIQNLTSVDNFNLTGFFGCDIFDLAKTAHPAIYGPVGF